jgi:hypothetical protein
MGEFLLEAPAGMMDEEQNFAGVFTYYIYR